MTRCAFGQIGRSFEASAYEFALAGRNLHADVANFEYWANPSYVKKRRPISRAESPISCATPGTMAVSRMRASPDQVRERALNQCLVIDLVRGRESPTIYIIFNQPSILYLSVTKTNSPKYPSENPRPQNPYYPHCTTNRWQCLLLMLKRRTPFELRYSVGRPYSRDRSA